MNIDEASNSLNDAQSFLNSLKSQAIRERKRRNLDLLWKVLTEMYDAGQTDYSLALVGRRLEQAGGPKTQSIRNEGGSDFRNLISVFSKAVRNPNSAARRAGHSQLDLAIDTLPDIGTRAIFRQVVAENRLLRAQNDQLRSAFKSLSLSSPAESEVVEPTCPQPANTAALTTFERDILRRAIDGDRLAENGWTIRQNGSVVDDANVVVLPPGFFPILKRLSA